MYTDGPPGDDSATLWYESDVGLPEQHIRELSDELLSLGIGLQGPDFCIDETACSDLELARELGAFVAVPVGATVWPSSVYGEDYQGIGCPHDMLGPAVNVAQRNHFSQEDIDHAVEQGVSFSATPETEMQVGHGIPVTGTVLEAGGRPTWGVDVCSDSSSDTSSLLRIGLQVQPMFDTREILENGAGVTEVSITW